MITLESTAATDRSTPRGETDQSGVSRGVSESVEPISQVEPIEAPKVRRWVYNYLRQH